MKIKIINGYDGKTCDFKQPHVKSFTEYCAKNGYEFVSDFEVRKTSPFKKERGYWWLKLYFIKKHLHDCDWLVWVDTDTVAINYGKRIEDFTGDFDFGMKKEATEEAGIILIRNSDTAKQFLDIWEPLVKPDFNDNEALTKLLREQPELQKQFRFFTGTDFSVKHPHYSERNNNTLFLHVSGCTTADKVKYMNQFSERWSWKEDVFASFINLDHRTDRLQHMEAQLSRIGLNATRTRGLLPHEVNEPDHKLHVMRVRTPGAIGCHYSQVSVIEQAYSLGKSALVMEDDLVFCHDFNQRMSIVENFLNNHEWDVFWLGGTYHTNPAQWHSLKHNPDLPMCTCTLNRDAEQTEEPRIMRTYGIWSTYGYIVNYKSIPKILELLDMNVYRSMGIDWLFIMLQPTLKTYCFAPGMVKQFDNRSDIGIDGQGKAAITHFSGFHHLGPYWYQENMNDFNPQTFNWGEAGKQ